MLAQAQGLQDFKARLDLFRRVTCQGNTDGIANAFGQKGPDPDSRLDQAGMDGPRFRNAHVQRIITL